MSIDLRTAGFLDDGDVDGVLGIVTNLLMEVAQLEHRVRALEASAGGDGTTQEHADDLVGRVMGPLLADPDRP